jgi:protein-ribulosamine 3-kinase
MEAVETVLPESKNWSQLAEMVVSLHSEKWSSFGLNYNNFIGDFSQNNTPNSDWNSFYVNHRILPMLQRIADRDEDLISSSELSRINQVLQNIDSISYSNETPSLLHGDLWRGNILFDSQGPLLIDPAINFGDREMDIAFSLMTPELTFDESFYTTYLLRMPLSYGYEYRQALWQLWPLLTHVVQDGEIWVPTLMNAVNKILDS